MAISNKDRQAAYKAKMREAGFRPVPVWANAEQLQAIKAFVAGEGTELQSERDRLAAWEARLAERESRLQAREDRADSMWQAHDARFSEVQELKRQLAAATRQAKEKPARGFKLVELANRRQAIAEGMRVGWGGQEREPHQLKEQADLSGKFSTEIKAVRTRLLTFIGVATGTNAVARKGGWGAMRFPKSILSESESELLLGACSLLGRIEQDVERAGHDTGILHAQREAEMKALQAQARAMADDALFSGLDRRGEVLFVAAANGGKRTSFSDWADLLDILAGKRGDEPAGVIFRRELQDQKGSLVSRLVGKLKSGDTTAADEYLADVVGRFRHPDTEEKYGELATRLTTVLVAEQIEMASKKQ